MAETKFIWTCRIRLILKRPTEGDWFDWFSVSYLISRWITGNPAGAVWSNSWPSPPELRARQAQPRTSVRRRSISKSPTTMLAETRQCLDLTPNQHGNTQVRDEPSANEEEKDRTVCFEASSADRLVTSEMATGPVDARACAEFSAFNTLTPPTVS